MSGSLCLQKSLIVDWKTQGYLTSSNSWFGDHVY